MRAWQTPALERYVAEQRRDPADTVAPARPSANHVWQDAVGWVVDLSAVHTKAWAEIDAKAEAVRHRYITPGSGQAGTYLIKERQAEAFKAAGYAGDVPAMVQVEAEATGLTAQQAADLILGERDFWLAKAAQIEFERRSGKIAVEAAADLAAVHAARDAALVALDAL